MGQIIAHLLLEAPLSRALLSLGRFERIVLEMLLVALTEQIYTLVSNGGVPGDLQTRNTAACRRQRGLGRTGERKRTDNHLYAEAWATLLGDFAIESGFMPVPPNLVSPLGFGRTCTVLVTVYNIEIPMVAF